MPCIELLSVALPPTPFSYPPDLAETLSPEREGIVTVAILYLVLIHLKPGSLASLLWADKSTRFLVFHIRGIVSETITWLAENNSPEARTTPRGVRTSGPSSQRFRILICAFLRATRELGVECVAI